MGELISAKRVLIAATGSGKGKTTVTGAILQLLKEKGVSVHSFKCGPDYIDPAYHEAVLGIKSKNLDPFFCNEELLRATFIDGAGDFNVIEGCMGLYDGIGTTSDCSPYTVAKMLKCPIILIVDGHGKGYSIVAEIMGFLALDDENLINGIIINRISEGYFNKIKPVIEEKTSVEVVGFVPRLVEAELDSRHLGLKSVSENHAEEKFLLVADKIRDIFDLDKIIKLGEASIDIKCEKKLSEYAKNTLNGKVIGVAKDEAFNFYYKDNLRILELSGAHIKYFSPIHDAKLPEGVDALYIGGGYPELYAKELSENTQMRRNVLEFVQNEGRVFGECGGFMYLNKSIDGYPMVGVFKGDAINTKKLVRFGYVDAYLESNADRCKLLDIKAHEFHHYDVTENGEEFKVIKASTGQEYKAGCRYKNCLASFLHLYFLSNKDIVKELFGDR